MAGRIRSLSLVFVKFFHSIWTRCLSVFAGGVINPREIFHQKSHGPGSQSLFLISADGFASLAVIGVLMLLLGAGVGFWSAQEFFPAESPPLSKNINMNLFWDVLAKLEENYLESEKIDHQTLLYGAVAGMVSALDDPYTVFLPPEANNEFRANLEGFYEGIGAQLGFKENQLVVVAPLEGSPAERVGIKPGDAIFSVEGEGTRGWSLTEAVSKIRGTAGTSVHLSLPGREVDVMREQIKIPAVRLEWLTDAASANKVAHVKVLRFGSDTTQEWDRVIKEIVREQSIRGVILDVRNNPGGFLDASIYLASEFFETGVVVKKETNKSIAEFKVDHACRICELPVVVLVNEGSASASEILAGAIQSRSRGLLVGEKTFGKGTVQESIEFPGGSAVHVTSARWLLPNGQNITEEGLLPEYILEMDQEVGPLGSVGVDNQLQKAQEIIYSTSSL